jgi:hypothetical protein
VASEVASFLVCGAGVFFGFATESVVRFLGMTDVYLNPSNNSQSGIVIRVCESGLACIGSACLPRPDEAVVSIVLCNHALRDPLFQFSCGRLMKAARSPFRRWTRRSGRIPAEPYPPFQYLSV